ncbi:MAG TPA: DinB family protein [Phycisphaerales bacterium]|nr:DinB family protein [Phycisphaerales bacterium]
MNAENLIRRLDDFGRALPAAVSVVTADEARWKPPSGAWSILEIVCHLGDEETDDFRTRLKLTLESPNSVWPPIDPEGWARERGYLDRELGPAVQSFVNERRRSVDWLRSLKHPDWARAHVHPKFGPISAGSLLASWAAHDALHLRQIAKRLYELARLDAGEHKIDYAGEWRA